MNIPLTEILLYICLLILLFLTYLLSDKIIGLTNIRQINIISFFFFTYMINLIGGTVIYFNNREAVLKINADYILMIFLGVIGVLLGAVFISLIFNFQKNEVGLFIHECMKNSRNPKLLNRVMIFVGLLASIILMLIYQKYVDQIPILYLLSGESDARLLKSVRASGYKTITQFITHPMNMMRSTVYPFFVALSLLIYLIRKHFLSLLHFLIILTMAVTFNSYTTALKPVAMLFVIIFLSLWILRKLSLFQSILIFLGFFSFPVLSTYISKGNSSLTQVLIFETSRLFERFILVIPDILLSYVEFYNGNHLLGSAHRPIAILLGKESVKVANQIFLYRDPGGYFLGNATVPFVGPLYADFGLIGVFLGSIIVGLTLHGLQIFLLRRYSRNILSLAVFIVFVWTGYSATSSTFTTGIISKGLVPILFMPFIINLFVSLKRFIGKGKYT